jgi:hypothetical protein
MQIDALKRRENFEMWYEDGDVFATFESEWKSEKDPIRMIGRLGGQTGIIKPDPQCLNYYIKSDKYEYVLHTHTLFKHYYIEGMLWDINGTLEEPPFYFITETLHRDDVKDGHVKIVNFKGKGKCFEIYVKDLSKLRVAAEAIVAIASKESWKGNSEGEDTDKKKPISKRIKEAFIPDTGITCEDVIKANPELEKYIVSSR